MEEAANELINMLLEVDHAQKEEAEKAEAASSTESKATVHIDSGGMQMFSF